VCPSSGHGLFSEGGAGLRSRLRNGDVDGMHRADLQLVEPRLDLGSVADHQDGQLVRMNVLLGRGIEVGTVTFSRAAL
jgi:hypothetical protein